MSFAFECRAGDGPARRGRLVLDRGTVETPAFMPVGTAGTVKGLTPEEVREAGAEMLLANTYHLYLRPGHERVNALGGLHRFMHWDRPILTDSGGYQVFSMADLNDVHEEGVTFRSYIDGTVHALTPEKSMEVQSALESDVAMAFDECPSATASSDAIERAVDRTTAWARRCREAYTGPGVLFGIVQGGVDPGLRERSAKELAALDFPGYAIGGLSVGETPEATVETARRTAEFLPGDRPRYLMGVGRPEDLVRAVGAGIDMFDCVMPTRNARNGTLFHRDGRFNIKRTEFRADPRPVDENCGCPACRNYSRAYLRHLFVSGEMLGLRLNTLHNLQYYLDLMRDLREAIESQRYEAFKREFFRRRGVVEPVG